MALADIFRRGMGLADKNSPALLTAAGVVGVVATAYLTAKATARSVEIIRVAETDLGESLAPREKFESTWKQFIPPFVAGALTITAIIAANRIGTRRVAAMAAVAAISERAYEEYKEKVREKFGEHKERAIRDEVAQDQVTKNPPSKEIFILADGDVPFKDGFSGRYFQSTVEKVRRAENDINALIISDFSASLTQFYDLIGLSKTDYSDEVGWNLDNRLNIKFTTTITEEQKPCMVVVFDSFPKIKFDDFH